MSFKADLIRCNPPWPLLQTWGKLVAAILLSTRDVASSGVAVLAWYRGAGWLEPGKNLVLWTLFQAVLLSPVHSPCDVSYSAESRARLCGPGETQFKRGVCQTSQAVGGFLLRMGVSSDFRGVWYLASFTIA